MGIVRDLYYARKMSAGLKLPAPTVALLIKRLRLAAAMGGGVEKTVSGSPAHITDALAKAALSVLASIEPIQDLHGYDHPWPAGGGKNLAPVNSWSGHNGIVSNMTLNIPANTEFTLSLVGTVDSGSAKYVLIFIFSDNSDSGWIPLSPSAGRVSSTKTYQKDVVGLKYYSSEGGWSPSQNITLTVTDFQIELGSTATSYAPYSNICPISGLTGLSVYVGPTQDQQDATTYAVDWTDEAGTVYGGTLDVVTGVLTVDTANIASYNGETITEPWISSMDAYVPGGTPTTGAQVVYTLATPITYQLSAQEVQMLLGENYVWSSSGDTVSVTYYAEGNANPLQSLNILLGGRYSNPKTADDVSDKEALEIILGGNK